MEEEPGNFPSGFEREANECSFLQSEFFQIIGKSGV